MPPESSVPVPSHLNTSKGAEGPTDTPGFVPFRVATIYLGVPLPTPSSDLPEGSSEQLSSAFCLILLQARFT
jgi:hypothetical protein